MKHFSLLSCFFFCILLPLQAQITSAEIDALVTDALAKFKVAGVAVAVVKDGKAQSIKMKGISPNIDFSFDFQDLDLQRVEK